MTRHVATTLRPDPAGAWCPALGQECNKTQSKGEHGAVQCYLEVSIKTRIKQPAGAWCPALGQKVTHTTQQIFNMRSGRDSHLVKVLLGQMAHAITHKLGKRLRIEAARQGVSWVGTCVEVPGQRRWPLLRMLRRRRQRTRRHGMPSNDACRSRCWSLVASHGRWSIMPSVGTNVSWQRQELTSEPMARRIINLRRRVPIAIVTLICVGGRDQYSTGKQRRGRDR